MAVWFVSVVVVWFRLNFGSVVKVLVRVVVFVVLIGTSSVRFVFPSC